MRLDTFAMFWSCSIYEFIQVTQPQLFYQNLQTFAAYSCADVFSPYSISGTIFAKCHKTFHSNCFVHIFFSKRQMGKFFPFSVLMTVFQKLCLFPQYYLCLLASYSHAHVKVLRRGRLPFYFALQNFYLKFCKN